MIKLNPIPRQQDVVFKNGAFVEKPNKKFVKLLVASIVTILFSCSYHPATLPEMVVEKVPVKTVENKIGEYISKQNKTIPVSDVEQIATSIVKWSDHFKVDPKLLVAVAQVESGFNKFSISSGGALGVMQMIPSWHLDKLKVATKELGSPELFDPNVNIYVGAWILKDCMKKFNSQVNALRCYSGSNAVPNGYEDKVKAAVTSVSRFVSI